MAESAAFSVKPNRKPWLIYLLVSLFSVLSLAFIIIYSYFSTYRSLTELALQRRQALSSLAAKSMEQRLNHLIILGKLLVSDLRFRQFISGGEWEEAISIHKQALGALPFLDRIILTDPRAVLMAGLPAMPEMKGKNFERQDWYRGVRREWKPYVSEVYRGTVAPYRNVVAVAIPVYAKDPRVIGVLILQIRLDTFLDWAREANVGPEEYLYFVDQRGNVIAHPKYSSGGDIVNFSQVPAVQRVLHGESGILTAQNPIDHIEKVTAFTPIKSFGWGAIVVEPTESAFQARENALKNLRIVYGLFLFFAGLSGVFIVLFIQSRRRREKELQESEALYRRWLNEATDGVWDWNLVTNEEYLSPHFKELFGYADHELANHASSWQKIIHPEDLPLALSAFKEHVEQGKPYALPVRYFHKNGSIVWVLCRGVAFKDKNGAYVRMLGTHTDISELIHVKEMNRLKDEFIDTVSHELRTPLTVVKEGVSLFQDRVIGSLDAEQRGFLTSVNENVTLLSKLIDTMLDLSKIEAGQLHLKKERVDLAVLIRKSLGDHRPLVGRRTVEVKLDNVPSVFADPGRILQVFSNLIPNAVKFTKDTGTLRISLEVQGKFAVISVQDDGVGIASKDIPKLFKKFSQVGKNFSQGTGLGLALCRQLIELHGGSIQVESTVGKGCTFTFTLPVGKNFNS